MEIWKKMWVGVFFLNTVHISDIYVDSLCIICKKNLIMKSRYFVRRFTSLLHDDVTGWTDYVNNG